MVRSFAPNLIFMSDNRDTFVSEIYVNNEQAQDAIAEMTKQLTKLTDKYDDLAAKNEKLAEKTNKAKAAIEETTKTLEGMKEGTEEYVKTSKRLKEQEKAYNDLARQVEVSKHKTAEAKDKMDAMKASLERAGEGVKGFDDALKNLSGKSMENLLRMQKQLKAEMGKTKPNTPEWNELARKYQDVTGRIKDIGKVQDSVTIGSGRLAKGIGGIIGKLGDFGSMITSIPVLLKGVRIGIKAITYATREVIKASQTMGDKWRNGMAAMKTTTEAFFMALSSGDWSAFNDGLLTALKNARELAELKDVLGDFKISEGVVQSEYLTNYNKARTTARDTEAAPTERYEALGKMEKNIKAYSDFVQREGDKTLETLMKSFDAWKGLAFDSEDEFHSFFIRLFEYTTTGYDEEVNKLVGLENEVNKWTVIVGNAAQTGGENIKRLNDNLIAAQISYDEALAAASDETKALAKAVELPDDKKQELASLFQTWKQSVNLVESQTQQMNRTRSQVMKQMGGEIEVMNADIDRWVENEKRAAAERYESNKASFDSIAEAYSEYQAELAEIEVEGEAKREAARQKFEEEQRKKLETERQKRQAAADKAYQNAQNKVSKAEAAQLNILKQMYASGIMDKQTYEAQKAVVEEDYLKQRMATAEQYGKDTDKYMNQLLDRQIARMEKARDQMKELMDDLSRVEKSQLKRKEADQLASEKKDVDNLGKKLENEQEILEKDLARVRERIGEDTWKEELDFELWKLNELHDQGILAEKDYQQAKLKIKLEYAQKAADQVNQIAEMASNFVVALKDYETQQLEAQYQAQLTAAGDNAEKREQIEAEYEQKKLELQKKYADVDMAINIAKTVANGAAGVVRALAEPGGVAGYVLAALVGVTTAAEIATIVAQRNAIKNASVSNTNSSSVKTGQRTVTGYAEGGYTEDHTTLTTVGERGTEWVAPHWMLQKDPVTFANLERYRKAGSHGRSGSVRRGFADGGYTNPSGQSAMAAQATPEVDWQAMREFNAIMRYCAENGLFVKYGDILIAKEKMNNFKSQTSR